MSLVRDAAIEVNHGKWPSHMTADWLTATLAVLLISGHTHLYMLVQNEDGEIIDTHHDAPRTLSFAPKTFWSWTVPEDLRDGAHRPQQLHTSSWLSFQVI